MKKLLLAVLSVALLLSLMAYSSAQAQSRNKNVEHFRIAVQAMPETLDANATISNVGAQVFYNIYDTLVMRDTHADEVKFIPGLAESWELIDELIWEIKLRPNVKFHDGSIMTAEDVAYSMNRVINGEDPSYLTARGYLLSNFVKFEAIDDVVLHAHTIRPEPLFEHLMSDPNAGISKKAYVESVGIDAAALAPITTGPYRVTSFEPGQRVELERFDDFWGEKAPFHRVTYTLIPEIISRITALLNGEVDFITNIPPDMELMLGGNPEVKLVGGRLALYHIYRINMNNEVVSNADLRAALCYAIDRQALVDALWEGKAEVAISAQHSDYGEPLYIAEMCDMQYDIEKAKELLTKSGYNGEIIRVFNVAHYYLYIDLASLAMIDMWRAIGVNAEFIEVESFSAVPADAELRSWSNPLYYVDPMGFIERHWAPHSEPVINNVFVPTEEYNAQFEIARYSTDVNRRVEALKEMYRFYRENTPFIFLYKPYESNGMNVAVQYEIPKNVRAHTIGLRAGEINFSAQ